jgi:ComF family protein
MSAASRNPKLFLWTLLNDFFSLFFPNFCFGCNGGLVKGEEILCTYCLSELPKLDHDQSDDNPILKKFIGRMPVKRGWVLLKFQKAGIVQNLLHKLKYDNRPEVGERLGKILSMRLIEDGYANEFDLLIPVPLHKNKRRIRGYNQSAMIAEGMGKILNVPFSDTLIARVKSTQTQTKKSKIERWENVNEAFQVLHPTNISGKRILIIDDVITTGATIESCAKSLLDAGAAEISIACLAGA